MKESERAGFVVALVKALRRHGWAGKTHIQKTAYFAQEAASVDLDLRFVIHHYGPYSFELESLLQTLDSQNVLDVAREDDGYGYAVSVGERAREVEIDTSLEAKAEEVAGYFATLPTAELELLSTSYYVRKRLPGETREAWIAEVHRLKPRFTTDEISRAVDESGAIAQELQQ